MHQEVTEAGGLLRLHRMESINREFEPVGCCLLDNEYYSGHQYCNDANCSRKVVVCPVFTQILIVYQYREGAVPPSDQHGSSEIGKGTHKYKQRCRQNCRHRQGHNHPLKPIHTFAAHALGRLQQRVVDIPECSVHIDYNQRKELQGLHKHNSSEPVDGYTVNPK